MAAAGGWCFSRTRNWPCSAGKPPIVTEVAPTPPVGAALAAISPFPHRKNPSYSASQSVSLHRLSSPSSFRNTPLYGFCFPRFIRTPAACGRRAGLQPAVADSGAGDPRRAGRPRCDGRRPDRHRQDRRLHPAHAAAAGGRPPGAAPGPRPGAHPDPGAGRPGGRERQRLRPLPERALGGGVRRCRHQPADRPPQGRPGRAGGHPRPAAGPASAGRGALRQPGNPGAGRSRPDARHGLYP